MARPYNKKTKADAALLLDICASSLEQFPLIGAIARELGIPDGSTPHRLACAAYYEVTKMVTGYEAEERFAEAAQIVREGWRIGDPVIGLDKTLAFVNIVIAESYPALRVEEMVTEQADTPYRSLLKERIETNNAVVESGNYPETWRDALYESPGPYPAMSNYEASMNDPVVVRKDPEIIELADYIPEGANAAVLARPADGWTAPSEDALDTDTVSIDVVTASESVGDTADAAPSVDGFDWNDGVK